MTAETDNSTLPSENDAEGNEGVNSLPTDSAEGEVPPSSPDIPNIPTDETAPSDAPEQGTSDKSEEKKKVSHAAALFSDLDEEPSGPRQLVTSTPEFIASLFADGNECITAPTGIFPVNDETRLILALFSNGRFLVAEPYKHDGRVLSFQVFAKKRNLQIGKIECVSMAVINDVYEYAQRKPSQTQTAETAEEQDQIRMQRDFVKIITAAAKQKVSDIHIVVGDRAANVYFRVNGLVQNEMEYTKEWGEAFVRAAFASADISDANYAQNEYQAAQKLGKTPLRGSHGRLMLPSNVLAIRMQFNPIAFATRYVVMRLLYEDTDVDNSDPASNLKALGFTDEENDIFFRLRAMPIGVVFVSGPTGSGKSTTLQRNMINMLKERNYELNLITVEDPPEYPILGARQMPVTNAGVEELKEREFTKALAAALRSDPDMLMIGEIRTLSAADLAFRGALSGHGVWTTIHANSAPATLMRLKDMGVDDFKLSDPGLIRGLVAQRLFRTICPHCRIAAKDALDNPAVVRLRKALGDFGVEKAYLRNPAGCARCDFRGVVGRTVIGEFIVPDATFLSLMLKGETKKAIDYWQAELGGRTLKDNAISRMLRGIIDIDEVERWTGLLDERPAY